MRGLPQGGAPGIGCQNPPGVVWRRLLDSTFCLLMAALCLEVPVEAAGKSRQKALPSPVSGKAVVCFIRPVQPALYYRTLFIHADDQFLGVLLRNSFTCAEVSPGTHQLWNAHADPDQLIGSATREVSLRAGSLSFFKMNYVEGSRPIQVEFVPLDEEQGRDLIKGVKSQTHVEEKDAVRAAVQIRLRFGPLPEAPRVPAPAGVPSRFHGLSRGNEQELKRPATGKPADPETSDRAAPKELVSPPSQGPPSHAVQSVHDEGAKGETGGGTELNIPAQPARRPLKRGFCAGKVLVLELEESSVPAPSESREAKVVVDSVKFQASLARQLRKLGYRIVENDSAEADAVLGISLSRKGSWKPGELPTFQAAVHLQETDGRTLWEKKIQAGRDTYPSSRNVWSSLARKTARRLHSLCTGRVRF